MGTAYLPDGNEMEYQDYIKTPEWKLIKERRLIIDGFRCAQCKQMITNNEYHTHHNDYSRLGDQNVITDVVTLCEKCHIRRHDLWERKIGQMESSQPDHWEHYSLHDTAALCFAVLKDDYWFGGSKNICNEDNIRKAIFDYRIVHGNVKIDKMDISNFVRNKRYEFIIYNAENGISMDDFLDEKFGKKCRKVRNDNRSDARKFYTKHRIERVKLHYCENKNINILMDEVKKMEEENNEQACIL